LKEPGGGDVASLIEGTELEAEALVSGKDLPAHAKPSYIAVCEYVRGLPVDQVCPYCNGAMSVEEHGAAWVVDCPCGRCKNSWKGL